MDALATTPTRRNASSSQDLPIDAIDVPEDGLRRVATSPQQDDGMRDSIRELGVIQPIIVHAAAEPGRFRLIAGRRRLRAAREVGLHVIPAEVRADLTDADAAAIEAAENIQRAAMAPVDTWRAIKRLRDVGWDLEAAAAKVGLGYRRAQQLEKLGRLHPEILARIERHGLPPHHGQLHEIASAPLDVQAASIGREAPDCEPAWWRVAEGCRQTRIPKDRAIFDTTLAGVAWEEDLFAEPGSPDQWTTNDVAGFLEAQRAALLKQVEDSKGKLKIAEADKHGNTALPKKWEPLWSWRFGEKMPRGATGFVRVDDQGRIVSQAAKPPAKEKPAPPKGLTREEVYGADRSDVEEGEEPEEEDAPQAPPTPEEAAKGVLTRRGEEMLAKARTTALRAALRDKPRDLAEAGIALLLAMTANNVRVDGEPGEKFTRTSFETIAAAAWALLEDARRGQPGLNRALARLLSEATARILICGPTPAGNSSNDAAEWVGQIVGAEGALPRLDTEEFLATMSGDALRQVAPALLGDSKAGKLSIAGLRQRLAGNAPALAQQGALAGLAAFCRAPPVLENSESYVDLSNPCGQQDGAESCACGWRRGDGEEAEDCIAALWRAELARLAPWPEEPYAVTPTPHASTPAPHASTPATDSSTAPAEHACRWDGQSKCPDDLTEACLRRCPRRDEYATWWESPAGALATASEQERAAAKLSAEAGPNPAPKPKRSRKPRAEADPPAPAEEVSDAVTQACGWDGEHLCGEAGTTRCEDHCQRNGRYRAWLTTPAGKAAQRVAANAEARANLVSRRGGARRPA